MNRTFHWQDYHCRCSKIHTKGYMDGCNGSLTKEEVQMLPMGAKLTDV